MDFGQLGEYLPHRLIRKRIRKTAIRRVRRELVLRGKQESEFSAEELEYLLADEEKAVISELQRTSLFGALALLGINLF
ncbi:MAG: hypothetical protein ACPHCJ_01145 [Oceanococcaceae bacterium]